MDSERIGDKLSEKREIEYLFIAVVELDGYKTFAGRPNTVVKRIDHPIAGVIWLRADHVAAAIGAPVTVVVGIFIVIGKRPVTGVRPDIIARPDMRDRTVGHGIHRDDHIIGGGVEGDIGVKTVAERTVEGIVGSSGAQLSLPAGARRCRLLV